MLLKICIIYTQIIIALQCTLLEVIIHSVKAIRVKQINFYLLIVRWTTYLTEVKDESSGFV